jgi:hypothetical protein
MEMKIKIREDAAELYIQNNTDQFGNYFGNPKWEIILWELAGQILEVDTSRLFKYEFNTKPIPGISKKGIRIPEEYVEEVIDDIRPGKAYCDFCRSTSDSNKVCTVCGKSEYLEVF